MKALLYHFWLLRTLSPSPSPAMAGQKSYFSWSTKPNPSALYSVEGDERLNRLRHVTYLSNRVWATTLWGELWCDSPLFFSSSPFFMRWIHFGSTILVVARCGPRCRPSGNKYHNNTYRYIIIIIIKCQVFFLLTCRFVFYLSTPYLCIYRVYTYVLRSTYFVVVVQMWPRLSQIRRPYWRSSAVVTTSVNGSRRAKAFISTDYILMYSIHVYYIIFESQDSCTGGQMIYSTTGYS